jgi:hypothetical protein
MNKNNQIRYGVENGNYITRNYWETEEELQSRLTSIDYHHSIKNDIFVFVTKKNVIEIPISQVEWKIFWDKLGNIPINEDEEIEEPFEHFEIGTNKFEIWKWFEWYFEITLGEVLN